MSYLRASFLGILLTIAASGFAQGPKIFLLGDSLDSIDVHTSWAEPGFVAVDAQLNDITGKVLVESNLDTARLGCYGIKYSVTDNNGLSANTSRTICTIDRKAPVLSLNDGDSLLVDIGTIFNDLGVTITDNYQKTFKIRYSGTVNTSKPDTFLLQYCTTDSSGNSSCVERTVFVKDLSPPKLTLKGAAFIKHNQCDSFIEPGYSFTDNYPQGVTIDTINPLKTKKKYRPGHRYKILYKAKDMNGNTDTISRTVLIVDDIAPEVILLGPKYIRVQRYKQYTDAGFTATDNCNEPKDLLYSTGGSFTNTVNTGLFYLKYHVADSSFNETTVVRTINVHNMHDTLSIFEKENPTSVSVSPNPFNNQFHIKFEFPVKEELFVALRNPMGESTYSVQLNPHQIAYPIHVPDFVPSGCYILEVFNNKQVLTITPMVKL